MTTVSKRQYNTRLAQQVLDHKRMLVPTSYFALKRATFAAISVMVVPNCELSA